ncbi:hypothetical protein CQ017_06190 [Arthrobacter sp. MYb224]|uniref:hypothetical protein n=1 Tax=Arthrobacter sp. MYb224 TaxID=1848600 RepID=UPI000CFDCAF7|nr:hypothetical protein [Arthrobacter sp. MYb224]PQZ99274.1 hypothetical protein CQ017_06190 [Arthrobacter sp. MYb224]
MVLALYLRELGGLDPTEVGPNSGLAPGIKARGNRQVAAGQIKQEWSSWWDSLISRNPTNDAEGTVDLLADLGAGCYPELAKLASAHYGQATLYAQQHRAKFSEQSKDYIPQRMDEVERILIDHGVEHAQEVEEMQIQVIDVPLTEPRAWLIGGATIVASTSLLRDGRAFHGYIQPMVTIIFP